MSRFFLSIRSIITQWIQRWQTHNVPPVPISARLSPEALAQVMREVQFLRAEHAVEVRELAAGEEAGLPRRADIAPEDDIPQPLTPNPCL